MSRRGRPRTARVEDHVQENEVPGSTEPNLSEVVAQLQKQVAEQQQVIANLMANQQPVPPTPQTVTVETPVVTEVPPAAQGVVTAPQRQEAYLIQWLKLKPESFSGTTEPWDAQAWFKTLESTMELLDWPEVEKVKCASFCLTGDARMWWERVKSKRAVNQMRWIDFETEFYDEFFRQRITNKHYEEFMEFRQGDLTVEEAVKRFNRLARICPELVSTEKERVRLMLRMLKPVIALNVSSGTHQPQTGEELVSRALVAEHYLNSMKAQREQHKPIKIETKTGGSQKPQLNNQNWKGKGTKRKQWNSGSNQKGESENKQTNFLPCAKCGRTHP